MKWKPALTLIEIMVAIGLLLVISVPSVFALRNIRLKQALSTSSEGLVAVMKQAHIYARESKENKAWGVLYRDPTSYTLIKGDLHSWEADSEFFLEPPTTFNSGSFEIWFDQGTGGTVGDVFVNLTNPIGNVSQINISKNGVVEAR